MVEQVAISIKPNNLEQSLQLAQEYDLGVEVMTFALPTHFDASELIPKYQQALRPITKPISMHAPFIDLPSGSMDPLVNQLTKARYRQALVTAAQIGAERVIFHANFIGTLRDPEYRSGWQERNIAFWTDMLATTKRLGVQIAIENMFEYDPTIIRDLMTAVDDPYFQVCIDVGHVYLYSDSEYSFADWVDSLEPWIVQFHVNNHNGHMDVHGGLDWAEGVLDYHEILPIIRNKIANPVFILEMDTVHDMRDSLHYFHLSSLTNAS